jgi:hypothetical protein
VCSGCTGLAARHLVEAVGKSLVERWKEEPVAVHRGADARVPSRSAIGHRPGLVEAPHCSNVTEEVIGLMEDVAPSASRSRCDWSS